MMLAPRLQVHLDCTLTVLKKAIFLSIYYPKWARGAGVVIICTKKYYPIVRGCE